MRYQIRITILFILLIVAGCKWILFPYWDRQLVEQFKELRHQERERDRAAMVDLQTSTDRTRHHKQP